VDQPCVLEHGEGIQQLSSKHLDELRAQTLELILFDEFVQVRRKKFENETEMVAVDKGIPQPQDVMFVPGITLVVELERGSKATSWMVMRARTSSSIVTSIIL